MTESISLLLSGAGGQDQDLRDSLGPLYTPPQGLHLLSDEFDDDVLDADWVQVDYGNAANIEWIEKNGHLVLARRAAGASYGLNAQMKELGALIPPFTIETRLKAIRSGGQSYGGLIISDGVTPGAGNQLVLGFGGEAHTSGYVYFWRNTGWNTWAGNLAAGNANIDHWFPRAPWFRLVAMGGNTWRALMSYDGDFWVPYFGYDTATSQYEAGFVLNPTHVGIGNFAAGLQTVIFDHFRVYDEALGVDV